MLNKYKNLALPLMAVVSGILLGAIVMLVFGYDPIWGYEELFYSAFGNIKSIGEIFRAMAPLVFTALGFAVASLVVQVSSTLVCLVRPMLVGFLLDGLPWQILTYHVQF
ncbi:ABC transporter permease [Streptococcus suis]|nr:ABC transporter permease [Streptococcus suis]